MPKPEPRLLLRRAVAELALMAAVGVLLAFLAPFDSSDRPLGFRMTYWVILIVGGGVIGIAFDVAVGRRLKSFWARLLADCLLMTPFVALLVMLVARQMYGARWSLPNYGGLLFQVFIICLLVMALRQLAWRAAEPAPSPTAGPSDVFRQRLSARRREAKLIAVEAEDHYLRVHTDAGDELITARFGDALQELAGWPGFRTHRSWWVAACAIDTVKWSRGRGELRLTTGMVVPVSRSQAQTLKTAGWR
jgi:predicted small integral membrane protein